VAASEITSLGEVPLDEKIKGFYCRTGNQMVFHFFHFRHRLPGSAARIITQNFASWRLSCLFKVTVFPVFIPSTPFLIRNGLGENGLRHS
jgi:hypothetical protein